MNRERILDLFSAAMPIIKLEESWTNQYPAEIFRDGRIVWLALHHRSTAGDEDLLRIPAGIHLLDMLAFIGSGISELTALHVLFHRQPDLDDGRRYDVSIPWRRTLLNRIIREHNLRDRAFWGASVANSITAKTLDGVATQVVGALYLVAGYQHIFGLANLAVSEETHNISQPSEADLVASDPKSALQRYSQSLTGLGPQYKIVERSGPEHNLTFRCRVVVGRRAAEGVGNSKRRAESAAAHAYLQQHVPNYLSSAARPSKDPYTGPRRYHGCESLPAEKAEAMLKIAQAFNFPPQGMSAVQRGVTTRAFSSETGAPNIAPFAQLGSLVLTCIVKLSIAAAVLPIVERVRSGFPTILAGHLLKNTNVAQAWTLLPFEGAMLCPQRFVLTEGTQADLIQGVLGAALVTHRTLDSVIANAPETVVQWIESDVNRGIHLGEAVQHSKSSLQEWTTALGLGCAYSNRVEGPDHGKQFTSLLTLQSSTLNRGFVLEGGSATNVRDSEAQVAAIALRTINDVHKSTSIPEEKCSRDLHCYLLEHSIASLPQSKRITTKWVELGALGTGFLRKAQVSDFWNWGIASVNHQMSSLYERNRQAVLGYYDQAGALCFDSLSTYGQRLAFVIKNVQSLSEEDAPELFSAAVAHVRELSKILDLSARSVLSSDLAVIQEDLRLLRVLSRECAVSIDPELPQSFLQREQFVTNLLCEAVLHCTGSVGSGLVNALSAKRYGADKMRLELCFAIETAPQCPDSTTSDLWRFYFDNVPVMTCAAIENKLEFVIGLASLDGPLLPACAHLAFVTGGTSEDHALKREASRLLHDIKNCLTACRSLLSSMGDSRTARLRAQLEVRTELDKAVALSSSLAHISGGIGPQDLKEFDIAEFMKTYALSLMTGLRAGVRLMPAATRERTIIVSEDRVLQLVLDNLIKNSLEAMPQGGELGIDWVFDRDLLLIEVKDSGAGMPPQLLQSILKGEPVPSVKRTGSGIGMLSVIALLSRLGGKLAGSSSEGEGTSWIISVPSGGAA
jgi:dsRNA-specific ribonuclease